MHLQQHIPAVWSGWTCTFSHSDLCLEAISLPCILMYVSYSHVAGTPACLSELRRTWTQSGCRTSISHGWHDHLMVCQISLLLSFQEAELLPCSVDITEVEKRCVCVCVCVCVCGCVCSGDISIKKKRFFCFFSPKHWGFCLICPEGFHM